jgi:RecJ-like exonuclease
MKLTIDDLIEKCPDCIGTGEKNNYSSNSINRSFGRSVMNTSDNNKCETCGGDGRVELTESGIAIMELIRILKKRGQA